MTRERLRAAILEQLPALRALRHDLHMHPELGYEEHRTSGVVARELSALGIRHVTGVAGGTGVVAHLPATAEAGDGARHAVALRADMDALPIEEQTGLAYASRTPGRMHACGHDGHTTILLGAARTLLRMERPHPVTLLFQPAEEGGAGGRRMCEDGVLEGRVLGPPVDQIYGLHGWPQLAAGTVATRPGALLAATDDFEVTIAGIGGHAAYPHLTTDPVLAACQCVAALQSIPSRSVGPTEPMVLSVTTIRGGEAWNVIPAEVTFAGTVRTLSPEVRALARTRFFEVVKHAASAMGCRAEIRWHDGYPVTDNDTRATERFFRVATAALGTERVRHAEAPSMGGEDFAFYAQRVPACYFLLGLVPPDRTDFPALHHPAFDFNDEAIPTGVELFCRLATEPLR